ncbi:rhodanese-like domain-containing protein [Testudinibacter sp. P27/CKL/0425]
MKILKLLAATLLLTGSPLVSALTTAVTPQTLQQNTTALLFDVRSADEFAAGHLHNAVNISHDSIGQQISQLTADKDQTIYVYCRSGRRADLAKAELEKLGYKNVENLGGYQQLKDAGFQ